MRALVFSDAPDSKEVGFITTFTVYRSRARLSINEIQRRTRRIAGDGKTAHTSCVVDVNRLLNLGIAQADSPRVAVVNEATSGKRAPSEFSFESRGGCACPRARKTRKVRALGGFPTCLGLVEEPRRPIQSNNDTQSHVPDVGP